MKPQRKTNFVSQLMNDLQSTRESIARLKKQLGEIADAPATTEEIKSRAIAEVALLRKEAVRSLPVAAMLGGPEYVAGGLAGALFGKPQLLHLNQSIELVHPNDIAIHLLAIALPAQLAEAFAQIAIEGAGSAPGMTSAQKVAETAKLESHLETLEHDEEKLIREIEIAGGQVDRRNDAKPSTYLAHDEHL